jgi:hypothetical protein
MNTQPYNSMVPAYVTGRFGEHHGMTLAEAEDFINRPFDSAAWFEVVNMSSASYILGQDAIALELAERSVALYPCTPTYINLAVILGSRGRFREAAEAAKSAYEADPSDRTAATLWAEHLLRAGRWHEAWPLFHNYYDSKRVTLFSYAIKAWTGQPLAGKRLLLIEGGGFGDNFFFLRWAKELKQRGAQITYLCPASMCDLMRMQPYIDHVIPTAKGEAVDDLRVDQYDYYVPLLALGYLLDKTVENPGPVDPWITVPRREAMQQPRIGFCWQAGEASLPRPFRSLDHAQQVQLTSLMEERGCKVESLVPKDWEWSLGWDKTAQLMNSCDLIITVDTGVAHLAGAMGLSTWVLLPGFSAWYYLLGSNAHPLYPSMRLFRNHARGLDIAVSACCEALRKWTR